MRRSWEVEISLGGSTYQTAPVEHVAVESGALVLFNGDIFDGRDIVCIFAPGGWTFARPSTPEDDE